MIGHCTSVRYSDGSVVVGWVTEHGHEFAGPAREIYLNDPTTTEPSEYLTEVQWPIT
ncbi:MAG: hypothetical protein QNJ12_11465 [Ilumatobacter sp.]|nr:GyrI-like domain-containing protein [Ilumatobacter sp.]MDJ0769409.1 hypothetical protein [Ilumatobacter sp.]